MSTPDFFQTLEFLQLRTTLLERGWPFIFEQSAQITQGHLSDDRGLFSFPVIAMGNDATSQTLALCRLWGASEAVLHSIAGYFSQANHVHFGLEFEAPYRTAKCYLEFESFTRFLAFKWSSDPAKPTVVSHYQQTPSANWQSIQSNLLCSLSTTNHVAVESMLRTIQRAGRHADTDAVNLLEVSDEGSERLSYDLNCYDFEIELGAIRDECESMLSCFEVPALDVARWLKLAERHKLGHLAFGRNRHQQEFVTLYHRDQH